MTEVTTTTMISISTLQHLPIVPYVSDESVGGASCVYAKRVTCLLLTTEDGGIEKEDVL